MQACRSHVKPWLSQLLIYLESCLSRRRGTGVREEDRRHFDASPAIHFAGYLNQGFLPWLGIAAPTAFGGMLWGLSYLLGLRSLVPAIVAHFLNDATQLPWISFFMVTGALGRVL